MPNRETANLPLALLQVGEHFNSPENRQRAAKMLGYLDQNKEAFYGSFQEIKQRESREVEFIYKKQGIRQATVGVSPTHNHTGSRLDTGIMTPTFQWLTDNFTTSLFGGDGSLVPSANQMTDEIVTSYNSLNTTEEGMAVDFVITNRNGVPYTTALGSFNSTNDVMELAVADANKAILHTKAIMRSQKYYGSYTIFCDEIAYTQFSFLSEQGSGNNMNTSFQFSGVKFELIPELHDKAVDIDAGYTKGFWVVIPDGTASCNHWLNPAYVLGKQTKSAEYSAINVMTAEQNRDQAISGFLTGLHVYEENADDSANNGFTQDVVKEWQTVRNVSFNTSPLSTADESTIHTFALV